MNQSNRYSFHDMGRKDFLTILFLFLKMKKKLCEARKQQENNPYILMMSFD